MFLEIDDVLTPDEVSQLRTLAARAKFVDGRISSPHSAVKNNLQLISALVDLQVESESETVPTSALVRIGQHARSLAAIHDLLTNESKSSRRADTISTTIPSAK